MAGSVVALALSACQWSSPITSMKSYDPSDGVSTQVGALHLNNLIVISEKQGSPGNLVGLAMNLTQQPAEVSVATVTDSQAGTASAKLQVPAGGTAQFTDGAGKATTLPAVQAPPGAMVQLLVQTNLGQTVVDVPVLPASGYYAKYGPAGAAASATPTSAPATPAPASPTTAPAAPTATASPTS